MQSFLVLSKNYKNSSTFISNFLKEKEIDSVDIDWENHEKTIGIEWTRNVHKKILLKPFKGKTKAIVIQAYKGITNEAQNALLKVLEEPPANTIIIISSPKKEILLSTVTSRLNIIELKEDASDLTEEEISQFNDVLNTIFEKRVGDKLKICEELTKNKEDASLFLERLSVFVRQKLIENYSDPKYLHLSKKLQKTYADVKNTNVGQRAAFENLFLSSF